MRPPFHLCEASSAEAASKTTTRTGYRPPLLGIQEFTALAIRSAKRAWAAVTLRLAQLLAAPASAVCEASGVRSTWRAPGRMVQR